MTFFPCRSAGKDRIKSRGSRSSPNQRAYRRPSACMPVQHPGRGILESVKAARLSQPSSAAQTTGRPSSASHRVLHAATLLRCYWGFLRFDFAMFAAALSSVREKRCNSKGGGRRALEGGPAGGLDRPTPSKLIYPLQKSI